METVESSRVLVVDDEPQITRVLKTVLSSQGYQVRTAAEGESALRTSRSGRRTRDHRPVHAAHGRGRACAAASARCRASRSSCCR